MVANCSCVAMMVASDNISVLSDSGITSSLACFFRFCRVDDPPIPGSPVMDANHSCATSVSSKLTTALNIGTVVGGPAGKPCIFHVFFFSSGLSLANVAPRRHDVCLSSIYAAGRGIDIDHRASIISFKTVLSPLGDCQPQPSRSAITNGCIRQAVSDHSDGRPAAWQPTRIGDTAARGTVGKQ